MQPPESFQTGSTAPSGHHQTQPKFTPAGFWIRFVAVIIDMIIVLILQSIVLLPFPEYMNFTPAADGSLDISMGYLFLSLFLGWVVVPLGYYGWFYKNKGGSPGKLLLGLRVLRSDTGTNLSYLRTWCREIPGKAISTIILMIGYIMAGFRSDKKALHDLIVGSQVVRKS